MQRRKYSPNSRCRLSRCLLAVLAMFLVIFSPSSYSWNEWNVRHFSSSQQKQLNLVPRSLRLTCLNYACAFSQSESRKYFEWIIRAIKDKSRKHCFFLKNLITVQCKSYLFYLPLCRPLVGLLITSSSSSSSSICSLSGIFMIFLNNYPKIKNVGCFFFFFSKTFPN